MHMYKFQNIINQHIQKQIQLRRGMASNLEYCVANNNFLGSIIGGTP